jgi:ABC-2 type transport system permease protein
VNAGVLRFAFRRSRLVLGLSGVFMLGLGIFFAAFYAGVRPDETMAEFMKGLPPAFQTMFDLLGGKYIDLVTPRGFLAMTCTHPLVLLTICAAVVTIASRGLAAEIGAGTIDLLLTHPVRRGALVAANTIVLATAAVLLAFALWCGHLIGVNVFPVPLEGYAGLFLPVAVHCALFGLFMGMLSLLVSSCAASRGRAVGVTVILIGVFLFIHVGATFYSRIEWMKRYTPFGYYEPARVVKAGGLLIEDALFLAGGAVALLIAASVIFRARQIP